MVQKPNSVVHVEFHSTAPDKTKAFLSNVFGWKFQDMPEMNYSTWDAPSAPGGGLQKAENMPAGVLDYILSTNIENTLQKIQSAGGAVVTQKSEIPGFGWFAVFQDPTGISLALYEPLPRPRAARAQPRRSGKKSSARGGKRSRRSR